MKRFLILLFLLIPVLSFAQEITSDTVTRPRTGRYKPVFVNGQLRILPSTGYTIPIVGSGGGSSETITGSNQNQTGFGLFLEKVNGALRFKGLAPGSNRVTLTDDNTNKVISVDVNPANITLPSTANVSGLIGALAAKQDALPYTPVSTTNNLSDLSNPGLARSNLGLGTGATINFDGSYTALLGKPSLFSGSYADLTNKPTIAAIDDGASATDKVYSSQKVEDRLSTVSSGASAAIRFDISQTLNGTQQTQARTNLGLGSAATLNFDGSYNALSGKPSLFSGSYTDLSNKPSLFSGSYVDLTNKPTLFSGSYADLTSKPTIPAIDDGASATDKVYSSQKVEDRLSSVSGGVSAAVRFDIAQSLNSTQQGQVRTNLGLGTASILNFDGTYNALTGKPSLFSGSYVDLTNKPTLFSGAYTDLSGKPTLGTSAALNVPSSGNAASTEVVKGNDSRLTDARTPTAHNHAASELNSGVLAPDRLATGTGLQFLRRNTGNTALEFTSLATVAGTGSFADLLSKPTTVSGYGISDAVTTGGSYSNPSFITGLVFSKLLSLPTTLSGYGITNAVTNSGGVVSQAAGLLSARPTAGTAGRFYYATDNQTTYYDNGSTWAAGSVAGAELSSNKSTNLTSPDNTKFPTTLAVQNALDTKPEIMSIAQLRADTRSNPPAQVSISDAKKEGIFLYDASDNSTADNTGTTLVTAAGKRYKRTVAGIVNLEWFGPAGDGTTDDTTPFSNALSYLSGKSGRLIVPKPTTAYKLTTDILTVPSNTVIEGQGAKIVNTETPTGTSVKKYIFSTSSTDRVEISGLWLDGQTYKVKFISALSATNLSVHDIKLTTATLGRFQSCTGVRVDNIDGSSSQTITGTQDDSWPFMDIVVSVNCDITKVNINGYGHAIQYFGGDAATGGAGGTYTPLTTTRGVQNLKISGITVKNTKGGGIWGSMGQDVIISDFLVEGCGDVGVDAEGGINVKVQNGTVRNCGNGNLATFFYCKQIRFENITSEISSSSGKAHLYIVGNTTLSGGSEDITITGCTFNTTSGYAPVQFAAAYQRIYFTQNKLTNTYINLANVNSHEQTVSFNDMILSNNSTTGATAYVLGSVRSLAGKIGKVSCIGNTLNISGTVSGGYKIGVQLFNSDTEQTITTVDLNRFIGTDLEVNSKYTVNQTDGNKVPYVYVRNNIFETNTVIREEPTMPTYQGSVILFDNNRLENSSSAVVPDIPTSGYWNKGQKAVYFTQTDYGKGEALCIASGTPGVWVETGFLDVPVSGLSHTFKGATVTASSSPSVPFTLASLADGGRYSGGNVYGYSSASTTEFGAVTITLNAGSLKTFNSVALFPRNDTGNIGVGFPRDFTIEISTDGTNWFNRYTTTGQPNRTDGKHMLIRFPLTYAQYIRISVSRQNLTANSEYRTQLRAIEVY